MIEGLVREKSVPAVWCMQVSVNLLFSGMPKVIFKLLCKILLFVALTCWFTELGGGFKCFFLYVHPYLGKISILANICQRGWFNHQQKPHSRELSLLNPTGNWKSPWIHPWDFTGAIQRNRSVFFVENPPIFRWEIEPWNGGFSSFVMLVFWGDFCWDMVQLIFWLSLSTVDSVDYLYYL